MRVGILISSHVRYFPKTVAPLMHSLGIAGVPLENIRWYIGGSREENVAAWERHVPYNSFDYTAMIGFAENPEPFDKVHILHDTVTVGRDYWNRVKFIAETTDVDCVRNDSNCGFWLYKAEALIAVKEQLQALKNIDKWEAMRQEGWFARHNLGSVEHYMLQCDVKFFYDDNKNVYSNGIKRVLEHHQIFDVWKRKANYAQEGYGNFNEA